MNGDMSFTAANRSDQLASESIRAAQRRYNAGLELRTARRASMANPHDFRNSQVVAAAAAHVEAAQAELDALGARV